MATTSTSAAAAPKPPQHSLPKQWADEIALVSSTSPVPSTTLTTSLDTAAVHTPPETLSAPSAHPPTIFSGQLDGFLDRFQQHIHHARSLKDRLDQLPPAHPHHGPAKLSFKRKMDHIRQLFATEGEDFVACLAHNPALIAVPSGESTIDLVRGIDRLELAVRQEQQHSKAAAQAACAAAGSAATKLFHTPPPVAPQQQLQHTSPGHTTSHPNVNVNGLFVLPPNGHNVTTPPARQHASAIASEAGSASTASDRPSKPPSSAISTSLVSPSSTSHAVSATDHHTVDTPNSMGSASIPPSGHHLPSGDRVVSPPLIPASAIGHTLSNLTSDETLQLIQSDIMALKVELSRLTRSNSTTYMPAPAHSLPVRSIDSSSPSPSPSPSSTTTRESQSQSQSHSKQQLHNSPATSIDKDTVPASILASNNNVSVVRVKGKNPTSAPTYVSHLEQMKSRIEALEKKPLSRRAKSVARLGRTHTMGSMYDPSSAGGGGLGGSAHRFSSYNLNTSQHPAATPTVTGTSASATAHPMQMHHSAHLLTRHNDPNLLLNNIHQESSAATARSSSSSSGGKTDENTNPAGDSRTPRKSKHRSLSMSTSSPLAALSPNHMHLPPGARLSSPVTSNSNTNGNNRLTPPHHPFAPIRRRSPPRHGGEHRFTIATTSPGSSPASASPGAKAPASGDSKGSPAKLFFDAPEEMLARPQSHVAARDLQRYSLKVARRFIAVGPADDAAPPPLDMAARMVSETGASTGVANGTGGVAGVNHGDTLVEPRAKSAMTIATSNHNHTHQHHHHHAQQQQQQQHQQVGDTDHVPVTSPSTIDSRVVEEIEGELWVRKGVVWKRWRRRYASIVSHQFFGRVMCLFGYDSSGAVIPGRSQIVVLNSSTVTAIRDPVELYGVQRYAFTLSTSAKEYMFVAESQPVRTNWIKELRTAAKVVSSRQQQQQQEPHAHTITSSKNGRSMAFRRWG